MICYRDRQWCSQKCSNLECSRNMTPAEQVKADAWWNEWKTDYETPIDVRDMKDSDFCKASGGYMEPIEVEREEVLMIKLEPPGSDTESKVWTEPGGLKS